MWEYILVGYDTHVKRLLEKLKNLDALNKAKYITIHHNEVSANYDLEKHANKLHAYCAWLCMNYD